MSTPHDTTERADVYQRVTDQIVQAIESGADQWKMPWNTVGTDSFSPINVASKRAYRGINILALWAQAQAKGYTSGTWATYKQWQEIGCQVRKGEKATLVVFWKFFDRREESEDSDGSDDSGTLHSSRGCVARGYHVFNADQVDGYTGAKLPDRPHAERIADAEEFFANLGGTVKHGGNRAFYRPADDCIQMPAFEQFPDPLNYYGTLAHEYTHWTGSKSRCDRQMGKRFGDDAYAAEELVAELGAAFVCSTIGIISEPRPDHAAYIQSWLKVLKADKRAIFTAASKAQQACDWMHAKQAKAVAVAA